MHSWSDKNKKRLRLIQALTENLYGEKEYFSNLYPRGNATKLSEDN
jgi:hypothetical protein